MANRVLLNSSALKVSQAGVNVLTATDAQLLFSADWAAMGIVQSGTYTVGTGSWSGSADTRSHSGTISLSKTYPSPPLCAFYISTGGVMVPVGFGSGAYFGWRRPQGANFDRVLGHFQVTTTQIEVEAMFTKQYTPSLAVPSFSINYFVFDYDT